MKNISQTFYLLCHVLWRSHVIIWEAFSLSKNAAIFLFLYLTPIRYVDREQEQECGAHKEDFQVQGPEVGSLAAHHHRRLYTASCLSLRCGLHSHRLAIVLLPDTCEYCSRNPPEFSPIWKNISIPEWNRNNWPKIRKYAPPWSLVAQNHLFLHFLLLLLVFHEVFWSFWLK